MFTYGIHFNLSHTCCFTRGIHFVLMVFGELSTLCFPLIPFIVRISASSPKIWNGFLSPRSWNYFFKLTFIKGASCHVYIFSIYIFLLVFSWMSAFYFPASLFFILLSVQTAQRNIILTFPFKFPNFLLKNSSPNLEQTYQVLCATASLLALGLWFKRL